MKLNMKLPGLSGLGALWVIFLILGYSTGWRMSLQWILQAGLLWMWVWYIASRKSDLNRLSLESPLLNTLGWANRLTLLRGFLIALTGGFLFQPEVDGFLAWGPGLVYGVAAILDRIDGLVARRSNQTTLLGAELDTAFDALGLLVVPLLAVLMGKIHWSYLSLSFAFYIFQWGLYWRRKHGLAIYPLMPSQLRRALAGFQMGFVALALLPCFKAQQTLLCSFAFLIPILMGFIFDWFVVSGRINAESITNKKILTQLSATSRNIFQPLLRLFIFFGIFFVLRQIEMLETSGYTQIFLTLSFIVGTTLVLLGLVGRVGALIILLLLSAFPISITVLNTALLFSGAWVLLLGTGRFSLWQWDDVWVNRKDGASV